MQSSKIHLPETGVPFSNACKQDIAWDRELSTMCGATVIGNNLPRSFVLGFDDG